jgi:hypothetical protein
MEFLISFTSDDVSKDIVENKKEHETLNLGQAQILMDISHVKHHLVAIKILLPTPLTQDVMNAVKKQQKNQKSKSLHIWILLSLPFVKDMELFFKFAYTILPLNSIVIDWGKQNPILIKRAGEQNLITFDAGNVQLRHMTEFPSSNNRADVVINSAETTIKELKERYPGIVLTDSDRLLQNAVSSKSNKKPADAELFATR